MLLKCQGRNHALKVEGSGWATDGARVEEGVGTVAVAAPGFSNEGWGAADNFFLLQIV